jgi:hypothetical protein
LGIVSTPFLFYITKQNQLLWPTNNPTSNHLYLQKQNMKEFTLKAILLGSFFGILFGAATVYLALKAGLTVSASIPIAVLAITLGRKFFKTTILENNIIQTTGSAGESVAAGVVFTLPGFLFLSTAEATKFFDYVVIFILAILGAFWDANDDSTASFIDCKRACSASLSRGYCLCFGVKGGRKRW